MKKIHITYFTMSLFLFLTVFSCDLDIGMGSTWETTYTRLTVKLSEENGEPIQYRKTSINSKSSFNSYVELEGYTNEEGIIIFEDVMVSHEKIGYNGYPETFIEYYIFGGVTEDCCYKLVKYNVILTEGQCVIELNIPEDLVKIDGYSDPYNPENSCDCSSD